MKGLIGISRLMQTLKGSTEGRVLLAGICLAIFHFLVLLFISPWEPELSRNMFWMTITHILAGRAAGLSYGYSLAYGHVPVIMANMAIETFMVFILYPLFVFAWNRVLDIGFLKQHFERTREAAEANRGWLRRFGVFGLFLFVWFPFWMTGPVVGCAIGYIIDLKTRVNLSVVLAGTYLAIASWAFLLRSLNEKFSEYTPYAPVIIIVVILLIVLTGHIGQRVKNGRGEGQS